MLDNLMDSTDVKYYAYISWNERPRLVVVTKDDSMYYSDDLGKTFTHVDLPNTDAITMLLQLLQLASDMIDGLTAQIVQSQQSDN